jgi:hypothetical protein
LGCPMTPWTARSTTNDLSHTAAPSTQGRTKQQGCVGRQNHPHAHHAFFKKSGCTFTFTNETNAFDRMTDDSPPTQSDDQLHFFDAGPSPCANKVTK